MINYFKLKKYRFLPFFILLLLSNYSYSQSLLTVLDGLVKPNGKPFSIQLNPTSTPMGCTSQAITLNIGKLEYLPGSSTIPPETLVTPTKTNGETTLTISGIVNGAEGVSRTIIIGAQFLPGTCDNVKQEITASIVSVGCNSTPLFVSPVTVTSKILNNVKTSLINNSNKQEYCLKEAISYRLDVTNNGNTGFNITNAQVFLELDKCAEIIGIYKYNTYESVNPVITAGTNLQMAVFNIPDLILSPNSIYYRYDIYVRYPCLDGINDCTPGSKTMSTYIKGKSCGTDITTNTEALNTKITTSSSTCGDTSCTTGGGIGIPQSTYFYSYFTCPTACNPYAYAAFQLITPPETPSYSNWELIVDIPAGLNTTGVAFSAHLCKDAPYIVKYINGAGEENDRVYPGSLTKKVKIITTCSLTAPTMTFQINFDYDTQTPPVQNAILAFNYKFILNDKTITGIGSASVGKCSPNVYISLHDVKKATAAVYENNYNVNAIPGEIITYKTVIRNSGTAADVNNVITSLLNENLEYAGGFKYDFTNTTLQYKNLSGNTSFTIPDLGTVTVATPVIGESGSIILSGFNFPCTNKMLYIEFNVRVKSNVTSGKVIPNTVTLSREQSPYSSTLSNINIIPFTLVKSKMFVKCELSNEWNDTGINVKNGENVYFKMQINNAGSNLVILSDLVNLKPQPNDQFEFGSNPRKSTFKINYDWDSPEIKTNLAAVPSVVYKYAQNSVSMDRDMFCPPQTSGNAPVWTSSLGLDPNWFKAAFPKNFTLNPGDFVEVIYKGKISGDQGIANNSFAFKVVDTNGNCSLVTDNSNVLTLTNDGIGVGCKSCTLTNPNTVEVKKLFENLLKNIITRLVKGETDTQINGSKPNELFLLRPYIVNGGSDKIYNFVSTRNAQNKITSIRFSFSANSQNDVSFLEENGLDYNPEIGTVDSSYLRIDTSLFASPDQYMATCRKTTGDGANLETACKSKTEVRYIDFCPDKFCLPIGGEIKVIVP